jgi:hypothetical protein
LQQFKNVALHPVDVGGRVLASGEVAELSPHAHAVHEAVTAGHLLALVTFQEAPADEADGDADGGGEKPEKTARKGSDKTTREES